MPEDYLYHKRMHKYENVDKITVETVSNFKHGALSGGKWTSSVIVRFFFKGEEILSKEYTSVKTALAGMPWAVETILENTEEDVQLKINTQERKCCDQPGCSNEASVYVKLNKITSNQNEYIDRTDNNLPFYRKFCQEHDVRGMADKEDSEANYTEFDKNSVKLGG